MALSEISNLGNSKNKKRKHMKIKTIICSAVLVGLAAFPTLVKGEDEKGETKVVWKDLPTAVQNAITAAANGGTVGEVEVETEAGKTTYEADITGTDGKKSEIKVGADGALIKDKDDDDDKGKGEDKDDDKK